MKCSLCPYKQHCHDAGNCEECDFGKAFEGLRKNLKRLKAKNKDLREENERLKDKIEILTNPNF